MSNNSNDAVKGEKLLKYTLEGLDCAGCAAKIEAEIQKIEGHSDVSLNFATKTISIDPSYEEEIQKIVDRIEPGVVLKRRDLEMKGHHHEELDAKKQQKMLIDIIISSVFLVLGIYFAPYLHGNYEVLEYGIFVISYFFAGKEVLQNAARNISRGQVFDENFLMAVATIGAFAIHQLPEAVGVMLFYSIGEYFQSLAVNRSRRSISALMDIRPDYANLIVNEGFSRISPEKVRVGDKILVQPGEKVPLDGIVIKGESFMDTVALTGESVPRRVKAQDEVFAGMINQDGLLEVKVTKTFGESSVSKILDLVENAATRKAKTEQFITKFARYYTPAVVFAALAIAFLPPMITGDAFSQWVYRALTLLVISCPCALVISIPLGYFGGIGGASRNGVLIKGANFLEVLTKPDVVVFDKTGTLTKGVFKVTKVYPEEGYSEKDIIKYAALAEAHSSHPIAKSILQSHGEKIDFELIKEYQEIAGQGIVAKIADKKVMVGNSKLLNENKIDFQELFFEGTRVYLAIDGQYVGGIVISDEIREDAIEGVRELKKIGVKKTVMLTGDEEKTAQYVANKVGVDEFYSELLPEDKVNILEKIQRDSGENHRVVFVGDGINDAPVIMRADVGVAMGGLGSDAAIEAADVVIMEDKPSKVAEAIRIAQHTRKIIVENVILALGIKGIFLAMGALGIATMWQAVFADVGVALLAVLNATRTLQYK